MVNESQQKDEKFFERPFPDEGLYITERGNNILYEIEKMISINGYRREPDYSRIEKVKAVLDISDGQEVRISHGSENYYNDGGVDLKIKKKGSDKEIKLRQYLETRFEQAEKDAPGSGHNFMIGVETRLSKLKLPSPETGQGTTERAIARNGPPLPAQ